MADKTQPCSASKDELQAGLMMFKRWVGDKHATRTDLINKAAELGCLEDIDERAWLCRQLEIEFLIDLTNLELVQLAVDASVHFNKRG